MPASLLTATMAGQRAKRTVPRPRSAATSPRSAATSPPGGIHKPRRGRPRRSARLQNIPSPPRLLSPAREYCAAEPPTRSTKRKRALNAEDDLDIERSTAKRKTRVASPPGRDAVRPEILSHTYEGIRAWAQSGAWPPELFEQDRHTRAHLLALSENQSLDESIMEPPNHNVQDGVPLARKRSLNSLRQQSDQGSTASDRKSRTKKSASYSTPRYETLLNTEAVYMEDAKIGPSQSSLDFSKKLLTMKQPTPEGSRFSDNTFSVTCERVRRANESKVIDKIARLIVPSVEDLADSGAEHLEHLVECHNAGWNNCNPIKGPRPQPDYSVGFGRPAWTEEQLHKLAPFIGELDDTSAFMATYFMYFPTFTCEVKCGAQALDIADRQNAHSAAIEVRGIVDLYKLVKREKELNREILAYSISHDHCSVRIHGYYPLIESGQAKIPVYRRQLDAFDFTARDGKERWTPAQFTRNLYDHWLPEVFRMLCSAIDQIPSGVSFGLSQSSVQGSSGLSQGVQDYTLAQTDLQNLQDTREYSDEGAAKQCTTPDTSTSKLGRPKKQKTRQAGSPEFRPKQNTKR